MLSIGLMSGTSMDGIDAALLFTDGVAAIKELAHTSLSFKPSTQILLKAAEYALRQQNDAFDLDKIDYLSALRDYLRDELNLNTHQLALKLDELSAYLQQEGSKLEFAAIVRHSSLLHVQIIQQLLAKSGYHSEQIDVIGYHGQTLFHRPDQKVTLQIGDAKLLAEKTRIRVVHDFRSRDVAAGGQGAPFAPLYHQALALRDQKFPLTVINCGGIANITLINGPKPQDLIGFDTGPGNVLIDRYIRQISHGQAHMDKDGHYGQQGRVHETVLQALYAHTVIMKAQTNYFTLKPPKSLDSADLHLIPELDSLSAVDACRTLEAFTADTIVAGFKFSKTVPLLWILAGGGWNNPVILAELKQRAAQKLNSTITIKTAAAVGWNNQALEAQIFAYLAVRCLHNLPISLPETTGVPYPLTGGQVTDPT